MRSFYLSSATPLRLAQLAQLCALLVLATELVLCRPQLIQLQHPESHRWPLPLRNEQFSDSKGEPQLVAVQQAKQSEPITVPHGFRPPGGARHQAMPGNVLVHFDDKHEISNIKYVMNDGRLATLFVRNQANPNPGKARQDYLDYNSIERVAGNIPGEEPIAPVALGLPSPKDHNIEIVNSTLQGVSQLVGGEHVTIDLSGKPMDALVPQSQGQGQGDGGLGQGLKVLATVAVDALHSSVHSGQRPPALNQLVGRLRHKVAKKLHEIPRIVGGKLRVKSSQGQRFVDHDALGNKEIVLSEGQALQVAAPPAMGVGTNMRSPPATATTTTMGNNGLASRQPSVKSDNANLMQAATMRSQSQLPSPPAEWM